MSAALRILAAGPGVTVQDAGRRGFLRYGVTAAGPMDEWSLRIANRAAGAREGAAALEISVGGIEATAEGAPLRLALAGGAFRVTLDGATLPPACLFTLQPGGRLVVRPGARGAWAYLAFGGALDLAPTLGSLSMHARSGLAGAGVRAGDLLPVCGAQPGPAHPLALGVAPPSDAPIRAMAGPQDDYFDATALALFFDSEWVVAPRSDRMAYALAGPRISHAKGFNIVSDGVTFGAIQIPGEGLPLVLMADRAPTGGYPKIACVIAADLGRIAQLRPGERLRFRRVTADEAVAALRVALEGVDAAARPPGAISTEALLNANLISGVTSGRA